jgi:hypothetical protein
MNEFLSRERRLGVRCVGKTSEMNFAARIHRREILETGQVTVSRVKKEVGSMSRKSLSALCLLIALPLSVAFGQGGGNGKAMTPVGAWDVTYSGEFVPDYKALWTLNFGGTSIVTAQGFPHLQPGDPIVDLTVGLANWAISTGHGSWEKIGEHTYILTVYTLVPWLPNQPGPDFELMGYVKAVNEFTLMDRDTLEGWCDISIVYSPDPSGPSAPPFPRQSFVGKRLRPEQHPMP